MKKIIATSLLIAALAVVPSAFAEEVSCSTSQYGGTSVCGVDTSTQTTTVEHLAPTGIDDLSLAQIIAITGLVGVAASVLYKLTYRTYLLG